MAYSVTFTPEAREQLRALYRYLARKASPAIAQRFTNAIVSFCERFQEFPKRVVLRNDIRPGLHITHYKSRVAIAFAVNDAEVSIIGVFYGGRDYEALLKSDHDD